MTLSVTAMALRETESSYHPFGRVAKSNTPVFCFHSAPEPPVGVDAHIDPFRRTCDAL